MFKVGDKVKVIDPSSMYDGCLADVIEVHKGQGMYSGETQIGVRLCDYINNNPNVAPEDMLVRPRHLELYDVVKEKDNINPDHYRVGGIDVWDYMKAKMSPTQLAGFAIGNVLKYVSRAPHKNKVEDLKKAQWYLNKLIEEIENGSANLT